MEQNILRPKWTISIVGGIGLLQMVSEPDIERCTRPRGMNCEVLYQLERGTKSSGCENFSVTTQILRSTIFCNDPDPPLVDIVIFVLSLLCFPSRL